MRQELRLYKCLGITKHGELIMVDYFFSDTMNGKPFHGATGTRFVPISQEEIEARNELEYVKDVYGYLWAEAVASGQTKESEDEYIQSLIDSELNYGEGMFLGHDTSYICHIPDSIKDKYFENCETFECVGGGRMFPLQEEMSVIFDQDLFDAVKMIEEEPYDLEMFADVPGAELKVKGE